MIGETLRRAAALMRERAGAVRPSPWWVHYTDPDMVWWGDQERVRDLDANPSATDAEIEETWNHAGDLVTVPGDPALPSTTALAEHIASWHPAVALAVADMLEAVAAYRDFNERLLAVDDAEVFCEREALAVARAYLGEVAS